MVWELIWLLVEWSEEHCWQRAVGADIASCFFTDLSQAQLNYLFITYFPHTIPNPPFVSQTFAAKPPTAQWTVASNIMEWRLTELTPGSKQLLEAYIGLGDPEADITNLTPPSHLPVILRCQSLDCTLSKVDLRFMAVEDGMVVRPKVQKRFRLSFKYEEAV